MTEEEDLLVECWSREGVKDKLDGTVRAVLAHEIIEHAIPKRAWFQWES